MHRRSHHWQNVEAHLHNAVIHMWQFITWLEYYCAGFETALKEAYEFSWNIKYDISLTPFTENVCLIIRMAMNLKQTKKAFQNSMF
jgi:hypothetical protein